MGDQLQGSSGAESGAGEDQSEPPPDSRGLLARLNPFSRREFLQEQPPVTGATRLPGQTPLTGMLNLHRLRVQDVAQPAADIVAVALDSDRDALAKIFRDSGLSRLPVFEGTLDSPVGLVHLKDFALRFGFNGAAEKSFDLRELLRPLLYVPPSMRLVTLLQKMQAERTHMALVIDEYGGTDGLITIEDLVEQVVGDIEDEHDVDEAELWTEEAPGRFVALAKTPLEDFEHATGLSLTELDGIDQEDIDTLGGLVFLLAGHVPTRREVVSHPAGVEFEVLDADPRRIKRLRVRLPDAATS